MEINLIQFIAAAIFIALGIVVMTLQTIGVFKIHYVLNRLHAAAMGDSLGIFLVILGLMIIFGFSFSSLKLLTILVVFWFASPACSHLLTKLEVSTNQHLEEECEVPKE